MAKLTLIRQFKSKAKSPWANGHSLIVDVPDTQVDAWVFENMLAVAVAARTYVIVELDNGQITELE